LSDTEERRRARQFGLHYCSNYRNLVRFNPEFCAYCPHNGLKKTKD